MRDYNLDVEKIYKLLNMASHPESSSTEATSALAHARKLVDGDFSKIGDPNGKWQAASDLLANLDKRNADLRDENKKLRDDVGRLKGKLLKSKLAARDNKSASSSV